MSAIRIFSRELISRKIFTNSAASCRFVSSGRHKSDDAASRFILRPDLPDIDIPKVSINEFLFTKIGNWLNVVATECAITGRRYTYDELRTKLVYWSRNLRKKLNLKKGDVVAVLLPNCPEYPLVTLGALDAGLVVTTLNPIYTPDEISRQLLDSSTKLIITLVDLYPLAQASSNVTKHHIPIITIKTQQSQSTPAGALDFAEFVEKVDFPDLPPAIPEDLAFLPYSSGTTGMPKGVQLTHSNIVTNISQFTRANVTQETTETHQDIMPAVLPKFHIYGLVATVLHPINKGCKIVTLPKFTPDSYISTLKKYKPHILFVAPPIVLFLASHPAVTADDLKSVRSVMSGAAPLGASDEERFLQKAQKHINMLQGYGLTETSPAIAMTRPDIRQMPGSQGSVGPLVVNTRAKIVDPNDSTFTPLGPNQPGEILVQGPQVMKGYHNRSEETEAIFQDGWLRTGDIGYYNEDNLLFVTDRLKELIKVKGFQVPPAELEEIVRNYPDVEDAAVIGVSHSSHGEVPRAYVVPKSGTKIDLNKLNQFVKGKVANYKELRGGIEIVDAIPKNAAGKIMRRQLKESYEKSLN